MYELFILELDVSPDEISIKTIAKILKYLDSINSDIAKLLGIPNDALIFNLKSIESGSIIITILQGVAIDAIKDSVATPLFKGLIGKENIQKIEDMGTLLRETFFNFISSPTSTIDSFCNVNTIKKRKELYKAIDNTQKLKSAKIRSGKNKKNIKKKNFIDYYA